MNVGYVILTGGFVLSCISAHPFEKIEHLADDPAEK